MLSLLGGVSSPPVFLTVGVCNVAPVGLSPADPSGPLTVSATSSVYLVGGLGAEWFCVAVGTGAAKCASTTGQCTAGKPITGSAGTAVHSFASTADPQVLLSLQGCSATCGSSAVASQSYLIAKPAEAPTLSAASGLALLAGTVVVAESAHAEWLCITTNSLVPLCGTSQVPYTLGLYPWPTILLPLVPTLDNLQIAPGGG